MSSLKHRLETALASCIDPAERASLVAQIACYTARSGDTRTAQQLAQQLREQFLQTSFAPTLNWVMLIDALVAYFDKLSTSAHDRAQRSFLCSRSMRLDQLCQQSAAWLAHFEFERSDVAAVVSLLNQFDPYDAGLDASARLRFSMVLGDALMYVGQRTEAQFWYEIARNTAVSLHDQVALGALMYNRAVFAIASMRIQRALGFVEEDVVWAEIARRELASARSFEGAIQVTALQHLLLVAEGRAAVLQGRFSEALDRFLNSAVRIEDTEERPNKTHIVADMAFCLAKQGAWSATVEQFERFLELPAATVDPDDRFVGLTYAVESLEAAGRPDLRDRALEMLPSARATCLKQLEEIADALAPWAAVPRRLAGAVNLSDATAPAQRNQPAAP